MQENFQASVSLHLSLYIWYSSCLRLWKRSRTRDNVRRQSLQRKLVVHETSVVRPGCGRNVYPSPNFLENNSVLPVPLHVQVVYASVGVALSVSGPENGNRDRVRLNYLNQADGQLEQFFNGQGVINRFKRL